MRLLMLFYGGGPVNNVKGFLIDLDGVMYVGNKPVPGQKRRSAFLKTGAILIVSSRTRPGKSRKTVAEQLSRMGLEIPERFIFTPPVAAAAYMKKAGNTGVFS